MRKEKCYSVTVGAVDVYLRASGSTTGRDVSVGFRHKVEGLESTHCGRLAGRNVTRSTPLVLQPPMVLPRYKQAWTQHLERVGSATEGSKLATCRVPPTSLHL